VKERKSECVFLTGCCTLVLVCMSVLSIRVSYTLTPVRTLVHVCFAWLVFSSVRPPPTFAQEQDEALRQQQAEQARQAEERAKLALAAERVRQLEFERRQAAMLKQQQARESALAASKVAGNGSHLILSPVGSVQRMQAGATNKENVSSNYCSPVQHSATVSRSSSSDGKQPVASSGFAAATEIAPHFVQPEPASATSSATSDDHTDAAAPPGGLIKSVGTGIMNFLFGRVPPSAGGLKHLPHSPVVGSSAHASAMHSPLPPTPSPPRFSTSSPRNSSAVSSHLASSSSSTQPAKAASFKANMAKSLAATASTTVPGQAARVLQPKNALATGFKSPENAVVVGRGSFLSPQTPKFIQIPTSPYVSLLLFAVVVCIFVVGFPYRSLYGGGRWLV
jgi:hypothetical protein